MTVERRVHPFGDYGVEPDSPHASAKEIELSQQTQALAYRASGTCRHWLFSNPGYSWGTGAASGPPYADIAAVDTWYDLAFSLPSGLGGGSQLVGFPWRFSESFSRVRVEATIATAHDAFFAFRADTRAMVGAVATTSGSRSNATQATDACTMLRWLLANQSERGAFRTFRAVSVIDSPTMPADGTRMVVIVPQVMVRQDSYGLFGLGSPGTVRAVLVDMVAMDLPSYSNVGD